ncbi:aminoglycoside phosphotransferase [Actinoplanes sp. SE50]|uniref:phosphotransferase n=1 Tax=unclassified Actinoplanes TaxID=2626549 RepID=UPI00023EBFC4|nr:MULTISPECIES: phosphotransferase [unclassified Actinoplanes]AEV87480.1 aminoglycoside phosphotransferase [Actinoplanes sp. SE50/110]ATO85882.1 aminoglycoside phosphotransferase [Actinoplanes sp. SE50]SLM03296.1 Phosphotransferase enzyme family protein [Actinoplanes sp. SE50/110]
MRIDWTALPEAVTTKVAARIGGTHAVPAEAGDHAEIAATVSGTAGKVFVKAACTEFGVRSLRYELRVSEAVKGPHSPAVEWHFEAAGWLVVGFEHCDGPHADLSPGSPHLDLLAEALTGLGKTLAPEVPLFTPTGRLGFPHPAMDGDVLVHSDLAPTNLMVSSRGLFIVDWAFATRAAPWVELAMLTQWLIGSGHTPEQAEHWLARFPAWAEVSPDVLDDFASKNATKWASRAKPGSPAWMHDLADWTGQWASHRRAAEETRIVTIPPGPRRAVKADPGAGLGTTPPR